MFYYKQLEFIKQKKSFSVKKKTFVELWGFEPQTFALPARRSSQLSYSPGKIKDKNFEYGNIIDISFFILQLKYLSLKNLFNSTVNRYFKPNKKINFNLKQL